MLGDYPVAGILPVTDVEKAKKFYSETLGLKQMDIGGPDDFVMYSAGKGTMFAIYKRPSVKVEHTQLGFNVDNIEKVMKELKSKGVKFEEYDMPGLKTVDGVATVDGNKSAWFKDPDGNIIAVNQM